MVVCICAHIGEEASERPEDGRFMTLLWNVALCPLHPFVSFTIWVQIRNMIMAILYIIMRVRPVCEHVHVWCVPLFFGQLTK